MKREPDADAAHDQHERDREDRGVRADERERDRAERTGSRRPTSATRPPPKRSVRRPVSGITSSIPSPCGPTSRPGDDHALAAHLLVVERHEDHRPEQRGAEAEGRQRGGARRRGWRTGGRRAADARCAARASTKTHASARSRRAIGQITLGAVEAARRCRAPTGRRRSPWRRSRAAPGRPRRGVRPRPSRSAGSIRQPRTNAITPIGTLTKKIHDQCRFCRITPADDRAEDRREHRGHRRRSPSPGPSAWGPATWAMISCATGMIIPPPAPCSTRKTHQRRGRARPAAQSAEPSVNSTSETR